MLIESRQIAIDRMISESELNYKNSKAIIVEYDLNTKIVN